MVLVMFSATKTSPDTLAYFAGGCLQSIRSLFWKAICAAVLQYRGHYIASYMQGNVFTGD